VLYGLKQASREWYLKLKEKLKELGFKRSDTDHRVFTKIINGKLFVIAVYVDNFLLFLSNISHIRTVKEDLKRHFEIKDLGKAKWILQMKIQRTDMNDGMRKLIISQEQYIKTILEQHGIADYKLAKTPMAANLQLPMLTEAEINIMEYQRCIRSLIYLMICICPDIVYSVGVLSRHVACLRRTHMQAIKRIFRYLHETSYYELEFQANNSNYALLIVYVDSDWEEDCMNRKSILGFIVLLNRGAISWGSKKQTLVLLSTVKTKFIAVSTAVKEILWHRSLFSSLDMTLTSPTSLLINNQGALDLIKSEQINNCTKHIDIKFRYVCDQKDQGTILSQHVAM